VESYFFTCYQGHHLSNRDSISEKNFNAESNYWSISYPDYFSAAVKRLLQEILLPSPEERITLNQILFDEWMTCPAEILTTPHKNPFTPFNSLTSMEINNGDDGISFDDSRLTLDKLLHQPVNFNFTAPTNKQSTINDHMSHSNTVFQSLINEENLMHSLAAWATDSLDNNEGENPLSS